MISKNALINFLLLFLVNTSTAIGQVSLGADVVSRYVWRGVDFGESMSVQPSLSYSSGNFEIGSWGSYSYAPLSSGANEHDIWVGYSFGSIGLTITDYYFPNGGFDFFDFDGVEGDTASAGAHWIESSLSYSGSESFPISILFGAFIYNDPETSTYLEVGYPLSVDGADLNFFAGATLAETAFYGTEGAGLISMGVSASKEVTITEDFSLPITVSYILNPNAQRTFLTFGISL
ncbi:MAG: hypothetical protein CMG75_04085 [Candidatus Marinimicrobia bacterium]|nr:hypothetical protein [Candidatus Neomarinimicrobiota bacterium]|tara:strand:+ start:15142 stop:15840 length:699 start_codon:yes stop_codon:yes gene_type:complete